MALISKSISRSRLYHFVQKRSNKTFIPFDSVCQNLILIKFFKFEFFIVSLLPLDRLILKFFQFLKLFIFTFFFFFLFTRYSNTIKVPIHQNRNFPRSWEKLLPIKNFGNFEGMKNEEKNIIFIVVSIHSFSKFHIRIHSRFN